MTSLVLQALRLALPDGSTLLEPTDLSLDARVTALVGANGCGKSSLCRVLAGLDPPAGGTVHRTASVALVDPQAMRRRPGSIAACLGDRMDAPDLARWLSRLGLSDLDAGRAMASLSGGEITRLALAAALAGGARYLVMDEPGAHLDRPGRAWLQGWLATHREGVLLVSHDRELLGTAARVVEFSRRRLHDHAMDFDAYLAQRATEDAAAARTLAAARRDRAQVDSRTQQARERADQRAAAGRRGRRGGDHGAMHYDFMRGRAEAGAGRRERAAHARADAAARQVQAARERLRVSVDFDLRLDGRGPPAGKRLLEVRGLRATAGGRVLFEDMDLVVTGPRRIGVCGANGSGKSRLLRLLAGQAMPESGEVRRPALATVWLDQRAALPDEAGSLLVNFGLLQPGLPEAGLRERLAWFGFRGDRVGQGVDTLSAGERMRLALCCHLAGPRLPDLLLLDEPDNHLDLESLATVEHALRQYPGALVVASHSPGFLDAIGAIERIDL